MTELFELMATQPQIGERYYGKNGRYRRMTEGNYVVYYRPIDDGIEVLRVLHGARDQDRLV